MTIKTNTCILALKNGSNLWFAGDRRCSSGMEHYQKSPRPKINYRNNILLGAAGHAAMCDELTDLYKIPHYEGGDIYQYIHNEFWPYFLAHLRSKELLKADELKATGKEVVLHGLVGLGDQLFVCWVTDDDCGILNIDTPYAIGCGGQYAMGALRAIEILYTDSELEFDPKEMLNQALSIAAEYSAGCDDNIDILTNKEL